jgi:radical SAM superfamily enzyme YgiQ (UPF0313 family)
MRALLISTYELGRQPFGLASPAATLKAAGVQVTCTDLAIQSLDEDAVREADLIGFHLPMHTATRISSSLADRVRKLNPQAHLCFYGLYAPVNESYLRTLGADTILGGEFEPGFESLARRLQSGKPVKSQPEPVISLEKYRFQIPDRSSLPSLEKYARLRMGDGSEKTVGYTEASRGCKHLCRHCPVVPVYDGNFRIVQREIVMEDVRRQVAAGAEHITFGDPDFLNGPGHAMGVVEELHASFPDLTYDITVKVEHLLQHAGHLEDLRRTGCLMVTSAVESIDGEVLQRLDKGHTRADFLSVVALCRDAGLILNPTFVAFTPWITRRGYLGLLRTLAELNLVEQVSPIQLAIRLLIPAGSRLMELPEVRDLVGAFDGAALVYPWKHADPEMDNLQLRIQKLVHQSTERELSRVEIFRKIWDEAAGDPDPDDRHEALHQIPEFLEARATVPYLTEPWYC